MTTQYPIATTAASLRTGDTFTIKSAANPHLPMLNTMTLEPGDSITISTPPHATLYAVNVLSLEGFDRVLVALTHDRQDQGCELSLPKDWPVYILSRLKDEELGRIEQKRAAARSEAWGKLKEAIDNGVFADDVNVTLSQT